MSSQFPAFTPLASFIGGLMLSVSTNATLLGWGRVLGVSGLFSSVSSDVLARRKSSSKPSTVPLWKLAMFSGFLMGGGALRLVLGAKLEKFVGGPVLDSLGQPSLGLTRLLLAGVLVGFGTKMGSGCTSGHMLGGLARLSKRSLIATIAFFSTALATAQLFPSPLPPLEPISTPIFNLATLLLLQAPLAIYTTAPLILPSSPATLISSTAIGVHFAWGLALAGMLRPAKILSFFYFPTPLLPLSTTRTWDPSLIMLALGGLLPNMLVWQLVKGWSKPIWNDKWELPTRKDVDLKLVVGSAIFGIGWGLSGLCPGPAVTLLGSLHFRELLPFCSTFILGSYLANILTL